MNLRKEDLLGIHKDRIKIGASLADVDPMQIDQTVCACRFTWTTKIVKTFIWLWFPCAGALWQHWGFGQTHLCIEGDGCVSFTLPWSLWEVQDSASKVWKVILTHIHIKMPIWMTNQQIAKMRGNAEYHLWQNACWIIFPEAVCSTALLAQERHWLLEPWQMSAVKATRRCRSSWGKGQTASANGWASLRDSSASCLTRFPHISFKKWSFIDA